MLFRFFQVGPADRDDDIATGTYADGAIGTAAGDPSAHPRERSQSFRRSTQERDYGMARVAGQTGAGLVA